MGDKDDYLTTYRLFFENFAATVDPEDQLPVNIAGYTITEAELPGEVIYWTTQYLTEKQCPLTLMTPLQRIILDEVQVASKKYPNEFGYNSDESEYVALRLMQAVTARVNDVCMRYLDNARLDTLPPPPPPGKGEFRTASSATKNSRRAMEDRHFEIGNLEALFGVETTEPTSFYAVYDGHAGSAAATYCAAHLHQYLVESPHFSKDLRRALHDAFVRTDAEFIRKSNQKRASGGSTAVVVCVRGRQLLVAWAGDSLALLAKRMRLMQLVHPHKPNRPDEKERIESSGGTVMFWGTWRVNGQLAVSRAIGDAQYKPYVTARPEIAEIDLDGDEDFVVVACDGLWDVVSEDVVAFSVYKQLASDPNDLKAVTKNLVRQAKRDGSEDNISVIVVFLKDPRDIAADNSPPMELGLDNAMVNAPPFVVESEGCKMAAEITGACADAAENDVSDSDSDDLGPETAVDIDIDVDDLDADPREHEPPAPTPPAHTVEEGHVDGNLVDNVAESGEESEDEWNYYKGEGEREQNRSEEVDEAPRSETPCQDNSAWESSSVDMNSSPLNPDAPVFVPGGSDVLLAESPRKPMPMDDIELPDVAQFQTEAVDRPAELQDLDNCDQLNGHHNISMEGVTEHLNGNSQGEMESLGFGFNVGIDQDKMKEPNLIHNLERIQKDTTDFCNIQVFQAHETNPFNTDGDDELFERLKNKERDPMNMSFYQEKDDDTCERFSKLESHVDLNAVQQLPDSDDEDIQPNGVCQDFIQEGIENLERRTDLLGLVDDEEPNNDIIRFSEKSDVKDNNFAGLDNFSEYTTDAVINMQSYSNSDFECNLQQETVLQTDTPESHKLLFEQIPEIPDGKSSELGFTTDDLLDPSESERDVRAITPQEETSQDVEMESKIEDSTSEDIQLEVAGDKEDDSQNDDDEIIDHLEPNQPFEEGQSDFKFDISEKVSSSQPTSPEPVSQAITQENIIVDVHQDFDSQNIELVDKIDHIHEEPVGAPEIVLDNEKVESSEVEVSKSPLPLASLLPCDELVPSEFIEPRGSLLPAESALLRESPLPCEPSILRQSPLLQSPLPSESPLPRESSLPRDSPLPREASLPRESPLPREPSLPRESPLPREPSLHRESPLPRELPLPRESPLPREPSLSRGSPLPNESPIPQESLLLHDSLLPRESPLPCEGSQRLDSPLPCKSPLPCNSSLPRDSPLPYESSLPRESPIPCESPLPRESPLPCLSPVVRESPLPLDRALPHESPIPQSPLPRESPIPQPSPIPSELQEHIALSVTKSPLPELDANEYLASAQSALISDGKIEASIETKEFNNDYSVPIPAEIPLPRESPLPADSPLPETTHVEDTHDTLQEDYIEQTKSPLPNDVVVMKFDNVPETFTSSQEADFVKTHENVLLETFQSESIQEQFSHIEREIESVDDASLKEDIRPLVESAHDCDVSASHDLHLIKTINLESETIKETEIPLLVESLHTTEQFSVPVEIHPEATEPVVSPVPNAADQISTKSDEHLQSTEISSETVEIGKSLSNEPTSEGNAPTPDLVPERSSRSDLVTDIDIGISESHAQEICVPVTSEIQQEDIVQPTIANEPAAAPVGDAPVAAAVAASAAVAAVGAAVAKAKTSPKKSPTTPIAKSDTRTPKPAPKTTASKTSLSATKRTVSATTTPRSPAATTRPAKTPVSATKSAPIPRLATKPAAPPATKPLVSPTAPIAKASAKPLQAAAPTTRPTTAARPPISRTAPKPSAPKPPAPVAAKPKAPAAPKLASAAPKPALAPARAAPKPREVKPKAPLPEKKPAMTNGDVKAARPPPIRAPTGARPAPRAAPPAPRAAPPAPRAAPPAAPAAPKPAAPKPPVRAPLDKQSKDLANKRITAKAAPPRTTTAKVPASTKSVPSRTAIKKPADAMKKEAPKMNGVSETKVPPSPPSENALLPDVIA